MNVNTYLERQYDTPPCWQLVADVYDNERGDDVQEFRTIDRSVRAIASLFRLTLHKGQHGFEQIEEPEDFCLVLMGKSQSLGLHHCGIYFEGSVLHALADGNLYQDMASLKDTYPLMQFWSRQ
jgi:hypothetical protein